MSLDHGMRRWMALATLAVAFAAIGAIGASLFFRSRAAQNSASSKPATGAERSQSVAAPVQALGRGAGTADGVRLPDFPITIDPKAADRAGIEIVTASRRSVSPGLRVPGRVEPNAYATVFVSPLVTGRIVRVPALLGNRVTAGQTLAVVYSPDLAEAETRYLSMKAAFEYDHQRLLRTERLVSIGAASQQELESVRAEHTAHETEVEGARSRLLLLGFPKDQIASLTSPDAITAEVRIPAPITGIVTERAVNTGQIVDPTMKLFTIADLSTVWVIGSVHERDFGTVRIGSLVVLTTPAYQGIELRGRVSYIDPQVDEQTRTASVRAEIPNRDGRLRFGMYMDMLIEPTDGTKVVTVAREAVQAVGSRSFVYLVDPRQPGRFVEREVQPGSVEGDFLEIREGLASGDTVVGKGSFYLRAERERLHPR